MVRNRKVTGKAASMPAGLLTSLSLELVITLLVTVVLTSMVLHQRMDMSAVANATMLVIPLVAWLGGCVAAAMIKRRRMVVSVLSGALYFLSLLSVTALFFGGKYQGVGTIAVLIAVGSVAAGVIGAGGRKGYKKGAKKFRYR